MALENVCNLKCLNMLQALRIQKEKEKPSSQSSSYIVLSSLNLCSCIN